jgi:hypothetical protein
MNKESIKHTSANKNKQSLAISKANNQSLTKNQQEFNSLTQRIEKLQKEIERKQILFESAVTKYGTELYPLKKELTRQLREMLDVLWQVYIDKPFSKPDQKNLKEIIREQVQELFQMMDEAPDDELKKIFQALEGERYDAAEKREKEAAKQQMQDMFDDMDIDIDLTEVDMGDKETLAEKMAEARTKMQQRQQEEENRRQRRQKEKKKTAKQLDREKLQQQADELKQKNISTIYKQLAKLFHPDLEQDELRRAEKESLMKELTVAYEAKNLHALLTLELKWIHKENDHLESLTEEKLAVYLQILREQAGQLESQKYRLPQHPRYSFLMEQFGPQAITHPLKLVQKACKSIETDIREYKRDIADFQSAYGLRHIKAMIKERKQLYISTKSEEEVLLQMLFSR